MVFDLNQSPLPFDDEDEVPVGEVSLVCTKRKGASKVRFVGTEEEQRAWKRLKCLLKHSGAEQGGRGGSTGGGVGPSDINAFPPSEGASGCPDEDVYQCGGDENHSGNIPYLILEAFTKKDEDLLKVTAELAAERKNGATHLEDWREMHRLYEELLVKENAKAEQTQLAFAKKYQELLNVMTELAAEQKNAATYREDWLEIKRLYEELLVKEKAKAEESQLAIANKDEQLLNVMAEMAAERKTSASHLEDWREMKRLYEELLVKENAKAEETQLSIAKKDEELLNVMPELAAERKTAATHLEDWRETKRLYEELLIKENAKAEETQMAFAKKDGELLNVMVKLASERRKAATQLEEWGETKKLYEERLVKNNAMAEESQLAFAKKHEELSNVMAELAAERKNAATHQENWREIMRLYEELQVKENSNAEELRQKVKKLSKSTRKAMTFLITYLNILVMLLATPEH